LKDIIIIGAGYAGILTAKKLAKRLKKDDSVRITVIDKNPFHTMLTELHEVAAGRVDEDSIKIGLHKVFAGRKVNVILDTVQSIDFSKKSVISPSNPSSISENTGIPALLSKICKMAFLTLIASLTASTSLFAQLLRSYLILYSIPPAMAISNPCDKARSW
jgi:NADH dehydrogenase FAD-containing subunit